MVLEVFKCRCISQNITNKTWSTKNQENSAHRFGDNYLCKIGLNPEELELLECELVITFFEENR